MEIFASLVCIFCAVALLTGCPDTKAPKDPQGIPTPKTEPAKPPAA